MITVINDYDGSSVDVRRKEIMCLSTEKPTDVANGSVCLEIDTGKLYVYDADGEAWVEQ